MQNILLKIKYLVLVDVFI